MNETETPSDDHDPLAREAAQWFSRMRGAGAGASRDAFETWLGESAAHRSAYNRAAEIFAMGKLLGDPAPARPARRTAGAGLAIAACAAIALAGGWAWLEQKEPAGDRTRIAAETAVDTRRLATDAGETRIVRLSDGSTIQLASATSLETGFDADRRLIRLGAGSARFTVAHATRPFVVLAGGGSVTARGTVFEVALRAADRVDVRLVEGAIDVALPRREPRTAQAAVRRLATGESLSFVAQPVGTAGSALSAPAAAALAAPAALPEFESVSVAELVALANHGAARPIRIGDPTLGAERVSGRFRTDDTRRLAERLGVLLGARVQRENPAEIVLRR